MSRATDGIFMLTGTNNHRPNGWTISILPMHAATSHFDAFLLMVVLVGPDHSIDSSERNMLTQTDVDRAIAHVFEPNDRGYRLANMSEVRGCVASTCFVSSHVCLNAGFVSGHVGPVR